jgi:hypothetical protein
MREVTYVPDTENDPGCETLFPFRVLLDDGLHQSEKLGRVVLDLAVDLPVSLTSFPAQRSNGLRSA